MRTPNRAGAEKNDEVLREKLEENKNKKLNCIVRRGHIVGVSVPFGIPPAAFLILISGTQNEQRFREQKSFVFRSRMRMKRRKKREK